MTQALALRPKGRAPAQYVFAVMGVTGAGKSTFIKTYTGIDSIEIGDDYESCTSEVQSYSVIQEDGTELTFLDTPGFDDSRLTESEVLIILSKYLAQQYKENTLLSGLIYVHSLTDCKMTGSSQRNLTLFSKLCGENAFNNTILLTTKKSEVTPERRIRSEKQLRDTYWRDMLSLGARMMCFGDTKESAQTVIDLLISRRQEIASLPLNIQVELVDLEIPFAETTAGDFINQNIAQIRAETEKLLLETIEAHEQAMKNKDLLLAEELKKKQTEFAEKFRKLNEDSVRLRAQWEGIAMGVTMGVLGAVTAIGAAVLAVRNPKVAAALAREIFKALPGLK